MNIVLFLNQDIYCNYCLSLLFDELKNHQVNIIISKKVGNTDILPQTLKEMKKFEEKIEPNNNYFEKYSQFFKIQTQSPQKVNSPDFLENFRKMSPDLVISIRFGQIFHENFIKIPKLGIINLHSGILPKYRGILASFWAILHGEKELGTTLHYITDKKIDKGDIIKISKSPINFNQTLSENIMKLYPSGCKNILNALKIFNKNSHPKAQSQNDILKTDSYFSYPTNKDLDSINGKISLF